MLKVGLTGGIGSGKSTVARVFEVLGIPVYYADAAAKELVNTQPAIKEAIIKIFGANSYTGNTLNRKFIASVVFSNEQKLNQLNAIIHPATITDGNRWMKLQTTPYAIKEAAILFESASDKGLDYVIGVAAPLPLRIQRTMHRDNTTIEEVEKRMARQMDEEEKMKRCDFVIYNDEKQAIIPQVLHIHQQLMAKLSQ